MKVVFIYDYITLFIRIIIMQLIIHSLNVREILITK